MFRDTSLLEDPLLVPELTIEANLKENTNIFDCLPLDQLFIKDGLKGELKIDVPKKRRKGNGKKIKIIGATEHNLQNIKLFPNFLD